MNYIINSAGFLPLFESDSVLQSSMIKTDAKTVACGVVLFADTV